LSPVIIGIVSRSGLNEVYLSFVSYVVLATFLLIELSFGVLTRSQAVTVPTLVFVYISYSLLPVKLQYAIVAGTVFMLSQLIFTLSMEHGLSKQVIESYVYSIFRFKCPRIVFQVKNVCDTTALDAYVMADRAHFNNTNNNRNIIITILFDQECGYLEFLTENFLLYPGLIYTNNYLLDRVGYNRYICSRPLCNILIYSA